MKDKEKQIEEMAKETCGQQIYPYGEDRPICWIHDKKDCDCICDHYVICERIYNAGYRKLPEDSVVLTLEELEEKYEPSETFMAVARELEELKQDLEGKVVLSKEEYEELKFTKNVLELREETIKYLEDANIRYSIALENKSKETAEKIYYKAEKKAYFKDGGYYDKDRYYLDMEDLKEILKQFGVEIKE